MANKSKKPTFRISRTLFYGCLAGGVVLFCIHLLLCTLTDASPQVSGIALLLIYGALIPAGVLLDRARLTRQAEKVVDYNIEPTPGVLTARSISVRVTSGRRPRKTPVASVSLAGHRSPIR